MSEKDWNGKPSIDKPWLKYYTDEQKNTPIPKMSVYDYYWSVIDNIREE